MHLKRLTIKGFKSFAEPVSVGLEPGVTVVVGPNGSGKSNFVDAVAWVLGAQAPSAVRSARMDDVIFAGTTSKPALGRAEVSLTFDNSERELPLEFSDVRITRTLFRDGRSNYKLNGVPCRLLDIAEMLSDRGVGRQQHVIVSQNQIDAVLNARPGDRRAVIEEAAGVLKYRRRRERSERRLANTDADLVRVRDLRREIRRQLRPLEKQAEAASRHADLVSELEALRVYLAGREIADLRAQLRHHNDETETRDAAVIKVQAEIDELHEIGAACEQRLVRHGGHDRTELLVRWEGLRQRARGLAATVTERRRRVEEQQAVLSDRSVIDALTAESEYCRSELAVIEAESGEADEFRIRIAEAEARLQSDQDDFEAEWGDGNAADWRITPDAATAAASAQGELSALRRSIHNDKSERGRLRERLSAGHHRIRANEERSEQQQQQFGLANAEVARLREAESAAASAKREAEKRLRAASSVVSAADAGRQHWLARHEALALAVEARTLPAEAIAHTEGVVGVLADLVRVYRSVEAAFEAVVGSAACVVVVDTADAARRVLHRLESADAHAAVISLDILRPGPRPEIPSGLTPLRTLVTVTGPESADNRAASTHSGHPSRAGIKRTTSRHIAHEEHGAQFTHDDQGEQVVQGEHGGQVVLGEQGEQVVRGGQGVQVGGQGVQVVPDEQGGHVVREEHGAHGEHGDRLGSVRQGIELLLDSLLVSTVIVDGDWQAALAVAAQHPDLVVVTAGGDRMSSRGWCHGRHTPAGVTAAWREAEQQAVAATAALSEAATKEEQAIGRLSQTEAAAADLAQHLLKAEQAASVAALALSRADSAVRREQRAAESLHDRLSALDQRLEQSMIRLEELQALLPDLVAAAEAERGRDRARAMARAELDRRGLRLSRRRARLAATEAGLSQRRRMIEVRLLKIDSRLARHEASRAAAARRQVDLRRRAAVLAALANEITARADAISAGLASERDRNNRWSEQAQALAASLDDARRQSSKAEDRLRELQQAGAKADIAQAELRTKLQMAVERLRSDHGIAPAEAVDAKCPALPAEADPAARAELLASELQIMGPVNPLALTEYEELSDRHQLVNKQLDDIRAARRDLNKVIRSINRQIGAVFARAFADVAANFCVLFEALFPGGAGCLTLSDPDDLLGTGINVEARPSGKRVRRLSLLSGGERTLAALAFLFAVFRSRPSPFYVLDEVEASLDDVNLQRFLVLVDEFRSHAQLVIVTHQRRTMEAADFLYGVSMKPGGSSMVVSERLSDAA